MEEIDLSRYNNYPFNPGGNSIKRFLWYCVNSVVFKTAFVPINGTKIFLLRAFGAKIGDNVIIKPSVNIKYAWNLKVGDHSWIGEEVWIDNLVMVTIGSNVCLSQGAKLITGSHDYKKPTFDLLTGCITIGDGVWIGALAVVNQGITISSHAVLTTGSVATKNIDAYSIYQGNPAIKIRPRIIEEIKFSTM